MVAWCLDAFAAANGIERAIVAAPVGHERAFAGLAPHGLKLEIVAGGESRSRSVAAALARVGEAELVAVHDAARPLVSPELIEAVLGKLAARPDAVAVIAAAPLTDTVKRAHEPRPPRGESPRGDPTVARTESREHLWAAQTPQAFRATALRQTFEADPQALAGAGDDAALVERAGGKVLIEPAPPQNLKVTTPADLRLAQLLLADRA